MSYATHCIPYDENCTLCNPSEAKRIIAEQDAAASRLKTGKACWECSAEFVRASGYRVCCGTCKRLGSKLRQSKYEETNRVSHANEARKRKARKQA